MLILLKVIVFVFISVINLLDMASRYGVIVFLKFSLGDWIALKSSAIISPSGVHISNAIVTVRSSKPPSISS